MSDEKMRDDYAPTALESMHNYWKRDVRKTFWILTVVFVLATALFTAVYADDPWAGMELMNETFSELDEIYVHAGGSWSLWAEPDADGSAGGEDSAASRTDPEADEGFDLGEFLSRFADGGEEGDASWRGAEVELDPAALFFHNLQACAVGMALGLIPFLFLPLLTLLSNAVVLGAVSGTMLGFGMEASWLIAGILPHGIFELPALLLSFALGFTLCRKLTARIFRRKNARPLKAIGYTLLMTCLFILPLLAVAAAIESWVTPDVMRSAMGG